ncbi:MAG: 1-deoxy-D-xylulose-5-phosphate reductoisomerase [Armatimonadota bacterium]
MKKLALLGSTGSIGTQVLDVVEKLPDRLQVVSLATNRNIELIAEQANRHRPAVVSVGREKDAARLRELLTSPQSIEIVWGDAGLVRAATVAEADVAVISVAGTVGLAPTIKAIEAGKDIALASKEVLVAAGSLVNRLVAEKGVKLLPIDSEHSAIFQCLQGADLGKVRRLMLTASGGALAGYNIEDLANVTVEQALAHPTWSMGRKITIDSATLMNKCLEIIEAHWLFGVDTENIEVIIHPQSIVHSMVEFVDGSVLAQMGIPDMRIPIQYALLYPERVDTGLPQLDLIEKGTLTFLKPDLNRYPALELAYKASRAGGTMPAVMNAANEVSVSMFLEKRIGYLDIYRTVARVMDEHSPACRPSLDQILHADTWARQRTEEIVGTNF